MEFLIHNSCSWELGETSYIAFPSHMSHVVSPDCSQFMSVCDRQRGTVYWEPTKYLYLKFFSNRKSLCMEKPLCFVKAGDIIPSKTLVCKFMELQAKRLRGVFSSLWTLEKVGFGGVFHSVSLRSLSNFCSCYMIRLLLYLWVATVCLQEHT